LDEPRKIGHVMASPLKEMAEIQNDLRFKGFFFSGYLIANDL
jgi:hypothetical protein